MIIITIPLLSAIPVKTVYNDSNACVAHISNASNTSTQYNTEVMIQQLGKVSHHNNTNHNKRGLESTEWTDEQFAQIVNTAYLYTRAADSFVPITSLPATYFVIILGQQDSGMYPVSYLDLEGYIDAENIEIVDFVPRYRFGRGEIILNPETLGINLRQQPDHTDASNILTVLSPRNHTMFYYGMITGSTVNANQPNHWYFVQATVQDTLYWGYVYGNNVITQPIPDNTIIIIPPPDINTNAPTPAPTDISDHTVYIIAGALSVPVLLIMFLLFKKPRPKATVQEKT